jgi:hypothetical protein
VEPVRVKLYGLVSMTRRRYLAQVVVFFTLCAALLAVWWFRWPAARTRMKQAPSPVIDRLIAFWNVAPWVILGLALVQTLEAWYVLRLFRRKEAERAGGQPARPA